MRRMREGDRWGRLSAVVDWRSERNAPRKKLSDMTRNTNVWDDLAAKGRLMRWPGEGDTGKKEWCIRIFLKGKWRAKGVCLCACTHANTHTHKHIMHAHTKYERINVWKSLCIKCCAYLENIHAHPLSNIFPLLSSTKIIGDISIILFFLLLGFLLSDVRIRAAHWRDLALAS